jgi:Domain of unknown function (DUF5122) beta-propeller
MFLLAQDNRKYVLGLFAGLLAVCVLGTPAAAQSSTPDPGVPEANGDIRCIVQSGNRVYVGGNFSSIGGVSRNRLAAFDATTGVVDANWNPNMNAEVITLAVSSGKVHAGGWFTTVNGGTARNYLAAFNVADGSDTGTADANWNPNTSDVIFALAVSGSKVCVGGQFTTVNGATARNHLAAFNVADGSDTGTALAWDPNANTSAYALAPSGSGVFAGGDFTTIGGNPKAYLAGFDSTVPVELSIFTAE